MKCVWFKWLDASSEDGDDISNGGGKIDPYTGECETIGIVVNEDENTFSYVSDFYNKIPSKPFFTINHMPRSMVTEGPVFFDSKEISKLKDLVK